MGRKAGPRSQPEDRVFGQRGRPRHGFAARAAPRWTSGRASSSSSRPPCPLDLEPDLVQLRGLLFRLFLIFEFFVPIDSPRAHFGSSSAYARPPRGPRLDKCDSGGDERGRGNGVAGRHRYIYGRSSRLACYAFFSRKRTGVREKSGGALDCCCECLFAALSVTGARGELYGSAEMDEFVSYVSHTLACLCANVNRQWVEGNR